MKQFELLENIRACADTEEKKIFDDAKNTIDQFFLGSVDNVEASLNGTQRNEKKYSIVEALQSIHKIAASHGIDFAVVNNEQEAKIYVAHYALEMLKTH